MSTERQELRLIFQHLDVNGDGIIYGMATGNQWSGSDLQAAANKFLTACLADKVQSLSLIALGLISKLYLGVL
jgi:hypothetical protein